MAQDRLIAEIKDYKKQITAIDVEKEFVVQTSFFKGAVEPAKQLQGLVAKLNTDNAPLLSRNSANELHRSLKRVSTLFNDAVKLEAQGKKPLGDIVNDFRTAHFEAIDSLPKYIEYLADERTESQKLDEANAEIEALIERAGSVMARAEETINQMTQAAEEAVTSGYASYFYSAEIIHEKGSRFWQAVIIVIALLLIAFAFFAPSIYQSERFANVDPLQLSLSKVLVFSVFATYLIVSIRSYSAHKHNALVNRHRKNAMLTFRSMIDAADETTNRDVILAYAAVCIFAPQSTGLIRENGGPMPLPVAAEVFNRATS